MLDDCIDKKIFLWYALGQEKVVVRKGLLINAGSIFKIESAEKKGESLLLGNKANKEGGTENV